MHSIFHTCTCHLVARMFHLVARASNLGARIFHLVERASNLGARIIHDGAREPIFRNAKVISEMQG